MATQLEPETVLESPEVVESSPAPESAPAETSDVAIAETTEAHATTTEGDRARDEKGRFKAKADGEAESTETAATEPATPDNTGALAVDAAAAPAAPLSPVETPWSMKVDGQQVRLDGAVVIPGKGILFPEAHADVIHKLLARGIQYEQERPRLKQQEAAARDEIAAEKAQLSVIGDVARRIFEAQNEDELATVILDIWQNKDGLQREAQHRKREAALAAREKALAPTPEQQQHEADVRLGESLTDAFAEAKAQPWATGLKEQDWQALSRVLEPIKRSFIVRVPEDVPAAGLRSGDLAFDADRFFQFLERQAGLVTTERSRIAEEHKQKALLAKATAQNTAALASSVKAPPSVASPEKPAPNAPGSGSVFTSKDEYDRFIRTGQ